jgi:2-keto-3-deoxy-L-rhamnonate aldolase RhmA
VPSRKLTANARGLSTIRRHQEDVMKALKDAMAAGRRVFGFNIRISRTAEAVAIARSCGFDWLFIDMEHSALDLETVQTLCLAGLAAGLSPLVRVPEVSWAARVLDIGAGGIIVPHVETAAQALDVAQRCLFAPLGHRSLSGPQHQLGLAALPAAENMRRANEQTVVVVMIESPLGVQNADAIAAVPGVDVVLIGSNDLSAEMGIPGALADARIEAAYRTVIAACERRGKQAGMGGIYDHGLMRRYLGLGIRFAQGGGDSSFMATGARMRMDFLRGLADAPRQ